MSTPLARAVRENYPKAEITYFVGNWSRGVLEGNPNIDKIFNYDDMDIIGRKPGKIAKLIRKMRKEKFDLCFNLEKSWHWGVLSYLFGAKARIGFDRLGEGFANNLAIPFDGSKYELEYYLDLGRLAGIKIKKEGMEIYLTKKEKKTAENFIDKNGLRNKAIIGISPGGADNPAQQAIIKRWPLEKYTELINDITEKNKKAIVILLGGENDLAACHEIKQNAKNNDKVLITAGIFTIKESAALMKRCRVFITHDSGPMHIAAAAGSKLIALFGPTQPERFAPRKATVIKSDAKGCPCYNIYGRFDTCKSNECMGHLKMSIILAKALNEI